MEANKTDNIAVPFMQRLFRNRFLLLFVAMGASVVIYVVGGFIRVLSH